MNNIKEKEREERDFKSKLYRSKYQLKNHDLI